MRKAGKKDLNQAAIVSELRSIGCSVQILNEKGVPDLLVGFRGLNYLFEVKALKGRKTTAQVDWHLCWNGQMAVIRTLDDALALLPGLKRFIA
jgi:hypothetical protein